MEVYESRGNCNPNDYSINLSDQEDGQDQDQMEMRRGPWTVEEDLMLMNYVANHGEGRWNSLARCAGNFIHLHLFLCFVQSYGWNYKKKKIKSCSIIQQVIWIRFLHPKFRKQEDFSREFHNPGVNYLVFTIFATRSVRKWTRISKCAFLSCWDSLNNRTTFFWGKQACTCVFNFLGFYDLKD